MGYTVRRGDSWETIAEALYWDQRVFTALMGANKGVGMLKPGVVILTPAKRSTLSDGAASDTEGGTSSSGDVSMQLNM